MADSFTLAVFEGSRARELGAAVDDNPYADKTREFEGWRAGWGLIDDALLPGEAVTPHPWTEGYGLGLSGDAAQNPYSADKFRRQQWAEGYAEGRATLPKIRRPRG